MMQATFASDGVSRNVLARIAADGPGLGPKAFNVKSARMSCPGAPSKGQMRTMTGLGPHSADRGGNQRAGGRAPSDDGRR